MKKWLQSKELFLFSFVLMTIKNAVLPATIGDSIIFVALCGLYGYKYYLKSKEEAPINEEVHKELQEIRSVVTALSMKPTPNKPPPNARFY